MIVLKHFSKNLKFNIYILLFIKVFQSNIHIHDVHQKMIKPNIGFLFHLYKIYGIFIKIHFINLNFKFQSLPHLINQLIFHFLKSLLRFFLPDRYHQIFITYFKNYNLSYTV